MLLPPRASAAGSVQPAGEFSVTGSAVSMGPVLGEQPDSRATPWHRPSYCEHIQGAGHLTQLCLRKLCLFHLVTEVQSQRPWPGGCVSVSLPSHSPTRSRFLSVIVLVSQTIYLTSLQGHLLGPRVSEGFVHCGGEQMRGWLSTFAMEAHGRASHMVTSQGSSELHQNLPACTLAKTASTAKFHMPRVS